MGKTKIEWATHTSNWLAGCTKVSPACTHCYAETMTARLATMPASPARYHDDVVADGRWTGRLSYDRTALDAALAGLAGAKKPRRVFANSMSDTFHASAPAESLVDLAEGIRRTVVPRDAALMLLTKRPERARDWQREHFPGGLPSWVWIGATVEDLKRAAERVPYLVEIATAGVRFLSVEPLLGPVDLSQWLAVYRSQASGLRYTRASAAGDHDVLSSPLSWVIAGGESGTGARPMHPDWARRLRDDCRAAGVPFFFKQWGEWRSICQMAEAEHSALYRSRVQAKEGEDQSVLDDLFGSRCMVPTLVLRADGKHMEKSEPRAYWSTDDEGKPAHAVLAFYLGKARTGRQLDGVEWNEVPRG